MWAFWRDASHHYWGWTYFFLEVSLWLDIIYQCILFFNHVTLLSFELQWLVFSFGFFSSIYILCIRVTLFSVIFYAIYWSTEKGSNPLILILNYHMFTSDLWLSMYRWSRWKIHFCYFFLWAYLDSIRIYWDTRIANSQAWAKYEFAWADMMQCVVGAVYVIWIYIQL